MTSMERSGRRKKWLMGCGGFILLLVVLFFVTPQGQFIRDLVKSGALAPPPAQKKYSATSTQNLKALYTAMSLYHDSEGAFPDATGWMDGIENRLNTADLKKGEAEKKLVRPDLLSTAGSFGYAMNDAASKKYRDDIPDKKAVLLFESTPTERNAHGDPKTIGLKGGQGITISGEIVQLP